MASQNEKDVIARVDSGSYVTRRDRHRRHIRRIKEAPWWKKMTKEQVGFTYKGTGKDRKNRAYKVGYFNLKF